MNIIYYETGDIDMGIEINNQVEKIQSAEIEKAIVNCKTKFNNIVSELLSVTKDANEVEMSIFKHLMELGLMLLSLYFSKFNNGNYGKIIMTAEGDAIRGDKSDRKYFSIFGKITITRHLYYVKGKTLAILDIMLNLPKRQYSYFLSEITSTLAVNKAYGNAVNFLKKYFYVKLSVSAAETIVEGTSKEYEEYYSELINNNDMENIEQKERYTVASFDGKGVPMIKKEAAKIVARLGKGEKKQKTKEALVGVKYNIKPNVRTAEEVATNLVYPEQKEERNNEEGRHKNKAENKRYIASIEKPKKQVMQEIHDSIEKDDFSKKPLICVMDGALVLWQLFENIFSDIINKKLILDIIHVVEYIWIVSHVKHKEGSAKAKKYVYEKLLLILQGKILIYIKELEEELKQKKYSKKKKEKISKVITYFINHKEYMMYDDYLLNGYPIGSGVVESACGHLVKDRMGISGARWGINGGESLLKLRSLIKSEDWEQYWDYYLSQAKDKKINKFFPDEYYESLNLAA